MKGGIYMDTLAIAAVSIDLKTCQLQQQAGISVLKMSMDNAQQSAQVVTDMIKVNTQVLEQSVNPHLGKHLDTLG
jgi:hypothetical protein